MSTQKDFGFLTLATSHDYRKAIGLALSLRISNPGIPIAIACSPKVQELVKPYFDHVVTEKPGLKGFVHKVYLDEYSPFKETFFFDSDILVFKPILPYVQSWGPGPYHVAGHYRTEGIGTFGLNRSDVLKRIGRYRLVEIAGAGHAFFRKPDCKEVFDLARQITDNYTSYAGNARYADEDVINIALTMLDLPPATNGDFLSRYCSARPGTMEMDALAPQCVYFDAITNQRVSTAIVHFADNEAPYVHTKQLYRLFRKFGVPTSGLLAQGIEDYFEIEIKRPLIRRFTRLRKLKRRRVSPRSKTQVAAK